MTHDAPLTSLPLSKQLGPVLRLAGFIVGADATVLEQTPAGERVQVMWSALSVLMVFAFTAGAWGVGLSIARGWGIENIVAGAFIGAVVTLVDRAMIPAHWTAQGQRLAQDHGLVAGKVPPSGGTPLRALSVLLRIAAAAVLSFVCSGFLDLALYQRDIRSLIEDQHRADNLGLLRQAETRVDGEIARIEDEAKAIAAERAAILQRLDAAQDQLVRHGAAKFDTAIADRAALTSKRESLATDIDAAKQDAHAEEFGGPRSDGTRVTVAARGPKFVEATTRLAALTAQLQAVEARIATIDQNIDGTVGTLPQADPGITAQIAALDARHARLGENLATLKANRTAAVAKAVQLDPAYVPEPAGLIVSATALETLAARSPWLKSRILAVVVALALLDLAALGLLLMTPAPPVYAVRLACRQQTEIGGFVAQACAEAAHHAAQHAKALSDTEDVAADLTKKRRQRARLQWLDDMLTDSFEQKRAAQPETAATA